MKWILRLFRIIRINFILMRYNIDAIVFESSLFAPFFFLTYFNPYYWFRDKTLSRATRIRLTIEELGPIFVKAAQVLSTRRDILPDDVALELSKLQDRVPPFAEHKARIIIETALQTTIETHFLEFDKTALASASIAQVHAATLMNGDSVVIKVLRPQIRKMIDRDIDLLRTFAKIMERYAADARSFKPIQLVEEIAQTLYDELDLLREGANASQLKRNFQQTSELHIPKIYWEFSTNQILVMERVRGIPIHDIAQLKAFNVDLSKLAGRLIDVFFTQVFRDSFFHADLHPGNVFVEITDPNNPQIILVDFGIVGSLNQIDQRYIAENMLAFIKRDYQRVAELHIASGWLPPDTRVDQFEGAIRSVSEPIFEQPLRDISFGKLLLRLFQVARRFQINIQPQLMLLQKTLVNIEGISRQLVPDLDLWCQAEPHLEKWLKKQVGFKGFIKRFKEQLPLWSEQWPEMPALLYEVLRETKQAQERRRFHELHLNRNGFLHKTNNNLSYFLSGILLTLIGISVWNYFLGV